MEALEFERLERIARNLPVWKGTLKLTTVQTEFGPVYMAFGKGYSSGSEFGPVSWHGVYAINYGQIKGMCRPCEANGDATEQAMQQSMLDDAVWFMRHMADRDMNAPDYKLSGNA